MHNHNLEILIVDDSELIIKRLIELIQDVKQVTSVKHAATYAQGDALLDEAQPHIALLDINLPDGSGVDLLAKIKTTYPAIKVIMFTNQASDYYKKTCKQLGAEYFLDKSTDFEIIPDIISSLSQLQQVG